jgi:hypothetical protein
VALVAGTVLVTCAAPRSVALKKLPAIAKLTAAMPATRRMVSLIVCCIFLYPLMFANAETDHACFSRQSVAPLAPPAPSVPRNLAGRVSGPLPSYRADPLFHMPHDSTNLHKPQSPKTTSQQDHLAPTNGDGVRDIAQREGDDEQHTAPPRHYPCADAHGSKKYRADEYR